jgi:hypothetical protein
MIARLLPAVLLLCATQAHAQQEDEQLWLQANTNVPVTDGVRVTLEQIARWGDRADGLYQTEFGALLGYRVATGVELGLGYRKVGLHGATSAANEDRLRQQLVFSRGPFTSRFRIDERFVPGGEVGIRVRPLLRYNHRVGSKGVALFVSHESFYLPNATDWGQRAGYERMRNIAGVTLPIGRAASVDIGYLNQFRPARRDTRAQMDHALTVQLTINIADLDPPDVSD